MSPCFPLLVFHHHPNNGQEDNEDGEMLMFSISKQSLHTNMKRGLLLAAGGGGSSSSSMCWATPQGWMLLITQCHDDTDDDDDAAVSSACLWNPLTGDKFPLPDITEEEHRFPQACKCLLSHKDPTRPGCVVVLFHPSTPDMWYCQVIVDNNDDKTSTRWRWRHYSYDIGNYNLPEAYRPPTKMVIWEVAAFQGRLYFINSFTDMCAIDFTSSKDHPVFHYFEAHKVDFPEGMCFGAAWLLDCDDQLFLVDVSFVGVDPHDIGAIRVHKMDFSSSSSTPSNNPPRWHSVRDIGDAVFLLEDTGLATPCQASLHGLKGNQVYFMKNFVEDDADLCVFDLESECQEITRVHHLDGLLLHRRPFWIVPPS